MSTTKDPLTIYNCTDKRWLTFDKTTYRYDKSHQVYILNTFLYWPFLPVRVWTRGGRRARPGRAPAASGDPPGSSPSRRWARSGWSTSSHGRPALCNKVWRSPRTPLESLWEEKRKGEHFNYALSSHSYQAYSFNLEIQV